MTNDQPRTDSANGKFQIQRTYHGEPAEIWDLWTTAKGIESWWAPDGFEVEVRKLELRPGGELIYASEPRRTCWRPRTDG